MSRASSRTPTDFLFGPEGRDEPLIDLGVGRLFGGIADQHFLDERGGIIAEFLGELIAHADGGVGTQPHVGSESRPERSLRVTGSPLRDSMGIKSDTSPSDLRAADRELFDVGTVVFAGRDDLGQDGAAGMKHADELVAELELSCARRLGRRSPTRGPRRSPFA